MKSKFKDLSNLFTSFEAFEDITNNNDEKNNIKNQLFAKTHPPFDLVKQIVGLLINYPFDDIYYEFTKKIISEKRVLEKIETYIEE